MARRTVAAAGRTLSLVILLAGVALVASGCIVAPAYGPYGYGPVYGPSVVVAPPPVVFGWGWHGWHARRW
jgi:hypothetical protein